MLVLTSTTIYCQTLYNKTKYEKTILITKNTAKKKKSFYYFVSPGDLILKSAKILFYVEFFMFSFLSFHFFCFSKNKNLNNNSLMYEKKNFPFPYLLVLLYSVNMWHREHRRQKIEFKLKFTAKRLNITNLWWVMPDAL